MKKRTITKFMLALTGIIYIAGDTQAQTAAPVVNQTTPISLISAESNQTTTSGGNLWGYIFGDYAFVAHGDSAGRGTGIQYKGLGSKLPGNGGQNQNAFEIRRVYLGYDYVTNTQFSGTTLLAYEGDADASGNRTVYLKYAYLKWKSIFKGSDLKLGQQATNSFATAYNTDGLYGYRAIERTIMDIHKVDGSSDMGIMLEGRLWTRYNDSTKFPEFIGYSIMVGDNSGNIPVPFFTGTSGTAVNTTTDQNKKYRGNVYFNTLNGALTIGAYADFINYGNVSYVKSSHVFQDATQTIKFYAGYNVKAYGFGFEWFRQTNTNGETEVWAKESGINDTVNAVQSGLSVFAHATIIKNKLNVFARYDIYNPNVDYKYNPNETFTSRLQPDATWKETFISAGFDWTPNKDKKVHFMPNIWYYGINNSYGSGALRSDYYAVYRLTFLYVFK